MKQIAWWILGLLVLSWSAGSTEESGLVLLDPQGEEVLRLEEDQTSTGEQQISAGEYLLRVEGPGAYRIKLSDDVGIEILKGSSAERRAKEVSAGEEGGSPVVLDFDLESGDQNQRVGRLDEETGTVALQLVALDVPELYGWSVTIEYDPEQVQYVENSFKPGNFLPALIPLVDAQEGRVQVGGANFSKRTASGAGDLGVLSFEGVEGFEGRAELRITQISFRKLDEIESLDTESRAVILSGLEERGRTSEEGEGGTRSAVSGEEALSLLLENNACPGCDLSGADLKQKNLREADLSGADLSGANLFRAVLIDADLSQADLSRANLMQAKLKGANLSGADLSGARLIGANLIGADLTDAVIEGARMAGAQLSGATWIDGRVCGRGSVGRCK